MPKKWTPEEEQFLLENADTMSRDELGEKFGVTAKSVSDKLRRLHKREEKSGGEDADPVTPEVPDDPLGRFGDVRRKFIMDFIRVIAYEDIAKMIGVKPDVLREAVEQTGIKLPIERAKSWKDIDVGEFRSISHCARCQVQRNQASFLVGIKDCRKCLEKNIAHWIEKGEPVEITFDR